MQRNDDAITKLTKDDMNAKLIVTYTSPSYFDLEIIRCPAGDSFRFVKKDFDKQIRKRYTVTLFEDSNVMMYGIKQNNTVRAFIEFYLPKYSRRMYIQNLFVSSRCRGKRLGSRLIEFAEQKARELKCRALFLDTESCNYNAIRFYQSHGFTVSGFDTAAFSNSDIERKEFSIYFSKKLN